MNKYQWVQTYGHDPRLPGDTLVNVKFPESLHNVVSVRADSVVWSMAIAYQRIDVPAAQPGQRDPHEHVEELQRWHNEACAERDALDAEVTRLKAQVADLERRLIEANGANEALTGTVEALTANVHAITHNFAEFVSATHAGVKRGIEVGDLPPDYYGRFGTTWAPVK